LVVVQIDILINYFRFDEIANRNGVIIAVLEGPIHNLDLGVKRK